MNKTSLIGLTAEQVRDSLLQFSGQLDLTMGAAYDVSCGRTAGLRR